MRPRPLKPAWDDSPRPKRKDPQEMGACLACGKQLVAARKFCHEGCARDYQSVGARIARFRVMANPDACWLWIGTLNKSGYGILSVGGVTTLVHRYVLEQHRGAPLGDLLALHKCNNRACSNPLHLYAGTHEENMRDVAEANRGSNKKTSWDDRLAIADAFRGGEPAASIAQRYGVTEATVRRWHQHFYSQSP